MPEPKQLRICKECHFFEDKVLDFNGRPSLTPCCTNEMCRDVVEGGPMPAAIARREIVFCGFEGRYWSPKEVRPASKIIELIKPA